MYISRLQSWFNEELNVRISSPVKDTVSSDINLQSSTHYVNYLIWMADNFENSLVYWSVQASIQKSKCTPIKEKHLSMV